MVTTHPQPVQSAFEAIPDPEVVRERLSQIAAEARLLRPLLKLAERKAREQERLRASEEERRGA
jgi:hypothetical protein